MSKKCSSRSQSGGHSSLKEDSRERSSLSPGEGSKKKKLSESDTHDGDHMHKKRKFDEDSPSKKRGSSHSDDKDSHKSKRGKKKSRHHKKLDNKEKEAKEKSGHRSSSKDDKDKVHTKGEEHTKHSEKPEKKVSKLDKIRAKFQGSHSLSKRALTQTQSPTVPKKEEESVSEPAPARVSIRRKSQKGAKLRKIKQKRRLYAATNSTQSSKFVRFRLLRRKRKQIKYIRTVSPSLSKALTVDPDLIEWIGENFDSELKLSEEVKEFVADDMTIRLHSLISNGFELAKYAGRKTLKTTDIDDVIKTANFGRIFGPLLSLSFTPNGKYYYDNPDVGVHLAHEANKIFEMKQAGVPYLKEQWYQSEQMTTINNNFYTSICKCIFSQNRKLALAALNGLKTTRKLNSQLVSQFCTFAFYTYVGGVGKKDLILIMIRILARNPSTALIQPGTGIKLLATILTKELFINKSEQTLEEESNGNYMSEVAETLVTLIECWKPLEYEILIQIEKCLKQNPTLIIPAAALRVLCSHSIEITKLLFWDKVSDFLNKSDNLELSIFPKTKMKNDEDDAKLWIAELMDAAMLQKVKNEPLPDQIKEENKDLDEMRLTHPTEVDYELKHRLLYASRFIYSSLSFSMEWSRDLSILLGDSLVPYFPHKGLEQYSAPQTSKLVDTIYRGVQIRRTSKKIEKFISPIHLIFDDYKYISLRTITIKYGGGGARREIVNKINQFTLHGNFVRSSATKIQTKTQIINIDIRKVRSVAKVPRQISQQCISHSLLMSL